MSIELQCYRLHIVMAAICLNWQFWSWNTYWTWLKIMSLPLCLFELDIMTLKHIYPLYGTKASKKQKNTFFTEKFPRREYFLGKGSTVEQSMNDPASLCLSAVCMLLETCSRMVCAYSSTFCIAFGLPLFPYCTVALEREHWNHHSTLYMLKCLSK